jgi:uroporphyrinogen-III synthase
VASGASLAETLPVDRGDWVLLVRGDLAHVSLPDRLAERGALVDTVIAYRTVEAPPTSIPLLRAALDEQPVAIVLTSGSTARGLIRLAEAIDAASAVRAIPAIAIGEETAAEATRAGFRVLATAPSAGPAGLADAVADAIHPDREVP